VEVTPLKREVHPVDPFALNLMRITVDGKPIDDPGKCSSDVQRCTDVALDNAQIQFKYDSLKLEPRMNVTAWPRTIRYQDLADTAFVENLVYFRLYTNYRSFIERAEIRIFEDEQSVRDTPIAIIAMDADGMALWQPEFESFSAPVHKLQYLVRVYDKKGRTSCNIWCGFTTKRGFLTKQAASLCGLSTISIHQLQKRSLARNCWLVMAKLASPSVIFLFKTVQAYGNAIPERHGVWMAGYEVPVDGKGNFVAEEILPDGTHTVEVAVLDKFGNGELFLRDLWGSPI
jgi:hypothetical protein